MIIFKENIYKKIQKELSKNPEFECGGILGKCENCITAFEYDKTGSNKSKNIYFPDVETLNVILKTWEKENINFCGFVHNHPNGSAELSNGDINFALKIINNFDNIDDLLMGIYVVTPDCKNNNLVWYLVRKDKVDKIYPDIIK